MSVSRGARSLSIWSAQMDTSPDQDFATTVVTVEEQMRGWLALIHRTNKAHARIPAYQRLIELFDFFARWQLVPFEERAADEFSGFASKAFALRQWTSKSPQRPSQTTHGCCRQTYETFDRSPTCKSKTG